MSAQGRMRIQSTRSHALRGLDPYFSPYEAIWPLLDLETDMPRTIWEPAAGDGRIVRCLRQSGFNVIASDLADYHTRDVEIETGIDYLKAICPDNVKGIVSNPPYKLALPFVRKAITEVKYSAWLLRLNFLEAETRFRFFKENPPARVLVSSRRLPMMHHIGWDGPLSTSNTCFAWFVWDATVPMKDRRKIVWFDWRDHMQELESVY